MRRTPALIALSAIIYAACSGAPEPPLLTDPPGAADPLTGPDLRRGGRLRLLLPDPVLDPIPSGLHSAADLLLAESVFPGLVVEDRGRFRPAVARSWERHDAPAEGGGGVGWVFRMDPEARFPDGRPVTPEDVIRSWERLLRSPLSPWRSLLDPVHGAAAYRAGDAGRIAGLSAAGSELRLRLDRETPDLLARLAHPALGVTSGEPPEGAGPFRVDPGGEGASANPFHPTVPPLDGYSVTETAEIDAPLLLRAGEVDAAVVFGREAGELLAEESGVRIGRIPDRDRTYAIVLGRAFAEEAASADPRDLLDVDRDGLLRFLFDARGEVAHSLVLPGPPPGRGPAGPRDAPGRFTPPSGTLSLSFDRDDRMAASIAARVKAAWEQRGISVELDGQSALDHRQELEAGEFGAAVLVHRTPVPDPLLALRGTLDPLREIYPGAIDAIDDAAATTSGERERFEAAARAERLLTGTGRLIPLVRLHAFLATDPRLGALDPARLRLAEIGWRR